MKRLNLFLLFFSILFIVLMLSGCVKLQSGLSSIGTVKSFELVNPQNPMATGQIYSSPAVSENGDVFVGGQRGLFVISSTASWCFSSNAGVYSSPSIDATNDMVFVGNNEGQLIYASYPFTNYKTMMVSYYPLISAPIIVDGNVYVIDNYGNIFKINEAEMTKTYLVTVGTNGSGIWASPVTNGINLFVGSDSGIFYAVNLNSGNILWQYKTAGPIYASAAIGIDGDIYVGSDGLYSFSPDGTLRWRDPLDGSQIYGSPVISQNGVVYIGTIDGNFYAINSKNGQILWSVNLNSEGGISSSALIGENAIYVASGYEFYEIDPSGQILGHVNVGYSVESNPVLYNGKIYFGCDNGKFYEISVFESMPAAGWPMFMHDIYHTGRQ
ncbi:PQQ-binding-like beta-propeller repeat protein [Athalassotoga saccharophila]|uniref:PQQ-binding-like beta-propeller repeat protein n=1 Tax=Athalassotoga saccharophila TaxID=1441386 RepID=UPI00137A760A|nr:PQQ-binding-like beta-propeller repeat protein [Athalassotoga saccharophila]BBJ28851.1 desiccation/radiation resistance protein [Athalassotoga saccharophila]